MSLKQITTHLIKLDDFEREIQQEDFLIEIAQRLRKQMIEFDVDKQQISTVLEVPVTYIEDILDSVQELTVRQIADLFSVFGKVLSLIPHDRHQRAIIIDRSSHHNIKKLDFDSDSFVFDVTPSNLAGDIVHHFVKFYMDSSELEELTGVRVSKRYHIENPIQIAPDSFSNLNAMLGV